MTSLTFYFLFIPLLAFILLAVNLIFAPHNPYQEKDSAFECGFHSFLGQNRTQFSISFFIFALLFLLFDLEILLVYPYIVSSYTNSLYGLVIMLIFFLALTLGFAFELGKKALNIESRQTPNLVTSNTGTINYLIPLRLQSRFFLFNIQLLKNYILGVFTIIVLPINFLLILFMQIYILIDFHFLTEVFTTHVNLNLCYFYIISMVLSFVCAFIYNYIYKILLLNKHIKKLLPEMFVRKLSNSMKFWDILKYMSSKEFFMVLPLIWAGLILPNIIWYLSKGSFIQPCTFFELLIYLLYISVWVNLSLSYIYKIEIFSSFTLASIIYTLALLLAIKLTIIALAPLLLGFLALNNFISMHNDKQVSQSRASTQVIDTKDKEIYLYNKEKGTLYDSFTYILNKLGIKDLFLGYTNRYPVKYVIPFDWPILMDGSDANSIYCTRKIFYCVTYVKNTPLLNLQKMYLLYNFNRKCFTLETVNIGYYNIPKFSATKSGYVSTQLLKSSDATYIKFKGTKPNIVLPQTKRIEQDIFSIYNKSVLFTNPIKDLVSNSKPAYISSPFGDLIEIPVVTSKKVINSDNFFNNICNNKPYEINPELLNPIVYMMQSSGSNETNTVISTDGTPLGTYSEKRLLESDLLYIEEAHNEIHNVFSKPFDEELTSEELACRHLYALNTLYESFFDPESDNFCDNIEGLFQLKDYLQSELAAINKKAAKAASSVFGAQEAEDKRILKEYKDKPMWKKLNYSTEYEFIKELDKRVKEECDSTGKSFLLLSTPIRKSLRNRIQYKILLERESPQMRSIRLKDIRSRVQPEPTDKKIPLGIRLM